MRRMRHAFGMPAARPEQNAPAPPDLPFDQIQPFVLDQSKAVFKFLLNHYWRQIDHEVLRELKIIDAQHEDMNPFVRILDAAMWTDAENRMQFMEKLFKDLFIKVTLVHFQKAD